MEPIALSILAILAAPILAWVTARGARRSTVTAAQITTTPALVSELYDRIGVLEARFDAQQRQVAELGSQLSDAAQFINRIGMWIVAGYPGRAPVVPDRLRPLIDTTLWTTPTTPEGPHDA